MDTKSSVQNLWGYTHEISGGTMKSKKIGMQALKIAIGSSLAIYIANLFGLKYSLAAGSVALLTMVTTKWKTVKLSVARVVTFIISVLMALIIFSAVESEWMAYGIYVFFVVIIAEMLGWGATISVNALIGMHFLEVRDFEFDFIANEFNIFKEDYDRKKEKILNGETPLESAKVFSYDNWFTYNDCYYIFNEVLKKVCKVIFLSCILNDVNKVLELNELEQAKKQIQELSNNVETEKEKTNDKEKIIEAYKRAFEKCNLNEPNNNEVDTDDDSEKKIAKLDSVIVELERTNSKLKEKLEKSIEENKELQDTIKNILPEESQADLPKLEVETKEIDYNKKYAFLMENRQQLELEENLKNVFPNCIIAKKANQINKSVDLVIFITEFLSHATYGSVKKFCKDAGIDFIHCQSTNASRIEQYIWDYYNTK